MSHTLPWSRRPEVTLRPLDGRGRTAAEDMETHELFSLGEQEAFLLHRLDGGRSADKLCAEFQERFGEPVSVEELDEFVSLALSRKLVESASAGSCTRIVQDFCPLPQSLEWRLSRTYWATRGILPFLRQECPYVINNDGRASQRAAALLFAYCEQAARCDQPIAVLELGAGSALFARLFLDEFHRHCVSSGRNYYERLRYYITDASPKMNRQWMKSGMFAPHAAHFVPAVCDAESPGELHSEEGEPISLPPLSAVFINYLLDQLPADIIRRTKRGLERLCVRTHLTSHQEALRIWGNPTVADVRRLAESGDASGGAELLRLLPLLEFETAYRTVDAPIPYENEALSMEGAPPQVVVSHGAVRCVLECGRLLRDDGFLVIRDMGTTTVAGGQARFPTRLMASMYLVVNFPLVSRSAAEYGWQMVEPLDREDALIETRLFFRGEESGRVRTAFLEQYRPDNWERADAALAEARQHSKAGRLYEALEAFRQAIRLSPHNWWALAEAGEYIALTVGDLQAGLQLAEQALEINPWTSPYLWTVKGDCLRGMQRWADARDAFIRAQALDKGDVRAAAGLAVCLTHLGDEAGALVYVARALAADAGGTYRGTLLAHQQQVLASLAARQHAAKEHLRKRDAAFAATLRCAPSDAPPQTTGNEP